MKTLLYLATIATCLGQVSVEPLRIPRENRLALSRFSDHIILVEITAVERTVPQKSEGLESRKLVIKAKVIEVVRGEKAKEIEYTDIDIKVTDPKELARTEYGNTDMFNGPPESQETGSAECKVGERYIMLYALNRAYFVRVSKDDMAWRSKIKKFEFRM